MIVGIDEVGRGPWAGPLVFCAVVLGGEEIDGLTDSKKLTDKKRRELEPKVREKAKSIGLGWVQADELDEIGMSQACSLACRRALEQISVPYHQIILDGTVNFLLDTGKAPYVTTMKQADLLVPSVSAASIVAKVARDSYMIEQARLYPQYDFEHHVGYGTKLHREAIEKYGVTPLHRRSFSPIKKYLENVEDVSSLHHDTTYTQTKTTTREIGNASENLATDYLSKRGFGIVERNWKKTQCEIDIIAKKDNVLYFVEVKHRKTDHQGGGFAAITPKKLQQMKFASQVYLHFTGQDFADCRLLAMSTTGDPLVVSDFLVID